MSFMQLAKTLIDQKGHDFQMAPPCTTLIGFLFHLCLSLCLPRRRRLRRLTGSPVGRLAAVRSDGRTEDGHLTSDTKNGGGGQIELKRKPRKKEEEKGEERVSVVRLKEAASGFIRASLPLLFASRLVAKTIKMPQEQISVDDFQPSHDSRFPFSSVLAFSSRRRCE